MTDFRRTAAFVTATLVSAGASAASTTSVASGSAPSAASLFQVLFGLIVVLALMAGIAWLMKRFGIARAAGHSVVKIVGGVSVGRRERVLVVEVADQWIVVGVAAGNVTALANMPRQQTAIPGAETRTVPANNFSAWLKQTMDRRNGTQ